MQIKKILCVLLCLTMLVGMLAGCDSQETPGPGSNTPPVSDDLPEDSTPPEDSTEITPPEDTAPPSIDHEAIAAALDVDESVKPELVRSSQYGLPLDTAELDTVNGSEFAAILDSFIELTAPDKLADWQRKYPALRSSTAALSRFNALAALYLAAEEIGSEYSKVSMWPWELFNSISPDWMEGYHLDEALFGNACWVEYDIGVGEPQYLDAAAYILNCGRMSLTSGKMMFEVDEKTNTIRYNDNCTGVEAILAVTRLIESAYEFEAEVVSSATLDTAVQLGVADSSLAARQDSIITRGELTDVIARIFTARYGVESPVLADMSQISPDAEASRLWFAVAVFFAEMQYHMDIPYETVEQLGEYLAENENAYYYPSGEFVMNHPDGKIYGENAWVPLSSLSLDGINTNAGFDWAVRFVLMAPDRTTGEKVMDLEGLAYTQFRPDVTMSVAQALAASVRYYNYAEDAALIDCDDMGDYDHSIITDDLLSGETSLPDASCENLPAQWRGVLISDMCHGSPYMLSNKTDKILLKADLDVIKEAGFNMIGLMVDFNWLQGKHPETGKLSEERLKTIDQIIAWCIELDMHVDLRCSGVGDLDYQQHSGEWFNHQLNAVNGTDYIHSFAACWGALARRYQDIPNTYLSFNLMVEPGPENDDINYRFFAPAVEAIRAHTPDRCIIADITAGTLTGESMAQLGVALSYHQYEPRKFCAYSEFEGTDDPDYLSGVAWPYEGIDIEAAMDISIGLTSLRELMALAEQYNVGIMVGEIGIFGAGDVVSYRYSDQTIEAYFQDIADTYAEYGIGWCTGAFGEYSVLNSYPAIKSTQYSTIENTDLYVDNTMMDIFQRINGVK